MPNVRLVFVGLLTAAGLSCRPPKSVRAGDPRVNAVVAVPAGLDTAATERWTAEQASGCRGFLVKLFDEGAIGQTKPDSTLVYHYERRLTGIRCQAKRSEPFPAPARLLVPLAVIIVVLTAGPSKS
jgi:hypothetical protein